MLRFFLSLGLLFIFSVTTFAAAREFNFETGSQTWVGDFTDYPEQQESFYELAWGWENLPANQTLFKKGIFLSGNNHSDDLFMFIKTPISGLKGNTTYAVTLSVDLASNIPVGSMGIGGSPGESVHIKIGAATVEPKKILVHGNYLLNVDKGDQYQSGKNTVIVGNLANPLVDPNHPQFALLQVNNFKNPIVVKSNDKGELWVFVGTDSGFEGPSKYYLGKISVHLWEDKL